MEAALSILYRGSLLSCNYDCSYCPFAKAQDSRESLARDASELARFVDWVRQQTRPIRILFTPWGEAFIRRYYQDAIAELGTMPQVERIAIQTNLSLSNAAIERCKSDKLALWCTYHPSQTSRAAFLEKCEFLVSAGVRFSVGMVGNRDEFDEISRMREALPPEIYLWVNANRDEQADYQPAELDQLRQLLALCSQDIGVILELCRREPLGRAVVLSGLPLRFPDGLRLVQVSLRGEASPVLEPGVSVLQIRRGLEVLADGLPGALRRRHCLRGLEALSRRRHSPRADRYSFPSPSCLCRTAEGWHTKAVVPAAPVVPVAPVAPVSPCGPAAPLRLTLHAACVPAPVVVLTFKSSCPLVAL